MFRRVRIRNVAIAAGMLALAGCSASQRPYEGNFTSMIGPNSTLTKTSGYGMGSSKAAPVANLDKPYFIEFRARNALTYGHAFVVFGVRDEKGNVPADDKGVLDPTKVEIAGLHPKTNYVAPFMIGHIVPVPAETGPSDGDYEEAYVLARYRINLTEAEFKKVVKVVQKHKKEGVFWSAPAYACVHFVAAISRDLGLKNPSVPYLPEEWTKDLKRLNGPDFKI